MVSFLLLMDPARLISWVPGRAASRFLIVFSNRQNISKEKTTARTLHRVDTLQDILLAFLPKSRQVSDLFGLSRFFQFFAVGNAQFSGQDQGFFWTDAPNFREFKDTFGYFLLQFLKVCKPAGLQYFPDFTGKVTPNTRNLLKFSAFGDARNIFPSVSISWAAFRYAAGLNFTLLRSRISATS